jgi:membrane glycosyltransferase
MLKRDRRWCAGNLQHFWFLFARGIAMGSRLQIWIGLMAYLCSPFWLIFLVAGSFSAYFRMRFLTLSADPEDLGAATSSNAALLFAITLALLFAPRLLGILTNLRRARQFGGVAPLLLSAVLENLLSVFLAPVLMIFHTLFVGLTVLGLQIKWTTQNRADTGLSFSHCLRLYGWLSGLGLAGQALASTYLGTASWWLTPIFAGWMLAPFLAWATSSSRLGLGLKAWGLFVTPEEVEPPAELHGLGGEASATAGPASWTAALLCPYVHAVHLAMVRHHPTGGNSEPSSSLAQLRERLIREGPQALQGREKSRLLWNADTVYWLHRELWSRPGAKLHPSWAALQKESSSNPLVSGYLISS